MMDALTTARILGGDAYDGNRVLAPGPGHSPGDRALLIKIDPSKREGFTVRSFSLKDDWRTCRDYVRQRLGLDPWRAGSSRNASQVETHRPPSIVGDRTEFPLQIWNEAVSAKNTLGETYFGLRKLTLPERSDDVIRFHARCPFGKGVRHPCLIALFRDTHTNEPKAIHRTALTPDGKKIGPPKMLGPKAGCAIKLTPDEDVTEGLTIAEGIETALAGMALNFRPTWALGDAGAVAKFPVLSGIESLTILTDNDANGTGQAAALECSRRWTSMAREVFRVVPTAVGADMADIVRGRAA